MSSKSNQQRRQEQVDGRVCLATMEVLQRSFNLWECTCQFLYFNPPSTSNDQKTI